MMLKRPCGQLMPRLLSTAICLLWISVFLFLPSCEMDSLIRGYIGESRSSESRESVSNSVENMSHESKTASEASANPLPLFFRILTGESCTEEEATVCPLAFLLGNSDASLPQYGLSYAEILIEAPTSDGTTKLLAVTTKYKEAAKFGPFRTAPDYITDFADAFDAVLVHAGTADGAIGQELRGSRILSALSDSNAFYKEAGRLSPHNIFSTASRIQNGMKIAGIGNTLLYTDSAFDFAEAGETVSLSGVIATHIRIDYSDVQKTEYRYSPSSGVYTRYQNGMAVTDALNSEAVTAQNILILYCNSTLSETESGSTLTLSTVGGSGVYATDGSYLPILWYKNDDGRLIFTREDGLPLTVNIGVTHIELVKASQKSGIAFDCN